MSKKKQELAAGSEKGSEKKGNGELHTDVFVDNKAELEGFLLSLRDRMSEETVAPIFALSAMNQILTQPDIYSLMSPEAKELARDVWLRLKQAGLHVQSPVLLFDADEAV